MIVTFHEKHSADNLNWHAWPYVFQKLLLPQNVNNLPVLISIFCGVTTLLFIQFVCLVENIQLIRLITLYIRKETGYILIRTGFMAPINMRELTSYAFLYNISRVMFEMNMLLFAGCWKRDINETNFVWYGWIILSTSNASNHFCNKSRKVSSFCNWEIDENRKTFRCKLNSRVFGPLHKVR